MSEPTDVVLVHLTRRNLLTLLSKLDQAANGEQTAKTIVKCDHNHKKYPILGARVVTVTAVEDADYYTDRTPGPTTEFPHGRV